MFQSKDIELNGLRPKYLLPREIHSWSLTHTDYKWGNEKRYSNANGNKKKAGIAILRGNKV